MHVDVGRDQAQDARHPGEDPAVRVAVNAAERAASRLAAMCWRAEREAALRDSVADDGRWADC